jgi:hypothetical protein
MPAGRTSFSLVVRESKSDFDYSYTDLSLLRRLKLVSLVTLPSTAEVTYRMPFLHADGYGTCQLNYKCACISSNNFTIFP